MAYLPPLRLRRRLASAPRTMIASPIWLAKATESTYSRRGEAAAFCGLVLVFGSKLVSCDAAGLPFGMVSEPRRRLEPTLAGGLVEYLAVKMYFRVSAEFLELCQRAYTSGCHIHACFVSCMRDTFLGRFPGASRRWPRWGRRPRRSPSLTSPPPSSPSGALLLARRGRALPPERIPQRQL